MTGRARSSAAGRLIARAARPAVRAAGASSGWHEVEATAQPPTAPVASPWVGAAPPPRAVIAPGPAVPGHAQAATAPPGERAAAIPEPPRPLLAAPGPPPPTPVAIAEAARPRREPLVAAEPSPPATATPKALSAGLTSAAAAAPVRPPEGPWERPEPVGWSGLAEIEPGDAATPLVAAPAAPTPRLAPAVQPAIQSGAAHQPAAAPATAPASAAQRLTPAAPSLGSSPAASSPPAAPASPAPAAPPQVLIDRIEVITPPARAPAPDPMASLVDRRIAASRHARAGR